VNAQQFNPRYPSYFPRFVQHAIWRYCAQDHMNVCNGNRIDDRNRCYNRYCFVFSRCSRKRTS
jgi:hypothetical protein